MTEGNKQRVLEYFSSKGLSWFKEGEPDKVLARKFAD